LEIVDATRETYALPHGGEFDCLAERVGW